MEWTKIDEKEIASWNKKLKDTNASFFQYPYYTSGYKDILFSKAVCLRYADENLADKAFCAILQIKFLFFKIGLIIRGPVMIDENTDVSRALNDLKKFAHKNHFTFLRINPNDLQLEEFLKRDDGFIAKNYFPLYNGSQSKDLNVYNMPLENLLKSFRTDCRNKIRFASEINFDFRTIQSEGELKKVYASFKELGNSKGFSYRPYKSYRTIFQNGFSEKLCSVYTAQLDKEIICSIFMVKDAASFNCLSGAMILKKELKAKHSPANKLHYLAMQDCFYSENKHRYNLSYSDPSSTVFMFKDSFHPREEDKPAYYTYLVNERRSAWLLSFQKDHMQRLKSFIRKTINSLKR